MMPGTMGPSAMPGTMPMGQSMNMMNTQPMMPNTMGSMPPQTMAPMGSMGPMGGMPFGPASGQYMPNVSRPAMTSVANPPVVANNVQYGPSYKMQYAKRSTADKTAVKYTGFLPLEGVYEEDTCRIG